MPEGKDTFLKAYLMYRDQDFDLAREPGRHTAALVQDLELTSLFAAMSQGDNWLAEVVKKAVLASTSDLDTIRYRQDILKDCLEREAIVREIYELVVETIETERKHNYYCYRRRYPTLILHGGADDRCPVGQAEQWFHGLRVRDVPVRLVLYPGGSHLFILSGRPSHRIDYSRRIIDWVTEHTSR